MKNASKSPWRRGNARQGFAIADAVVAMVILTVAIGGLAGSVAFGLRLHRTNRETALAEEAARQILANLRTVPFQDIFNTFSAAADIEVEGLNPRPDDPDGMVAQLIFPVDGAGNLSEQADIPALGCPRDLNGQDGIDGLAHNTDYIILPVMLRLEWRGAGGDATQVYHVVLTQ